MLDSMKNKWDYSGVNEVIYGRFENYEKVAKFLGDHVEDWGCGTGYARKYFKNYKGIDGSTSRFISERDIIDLVDYTSDVDNILMRQVLETNHGWRTILENVKKSFRKKFCLVIMSPFKEETQVLETEKILDKNGVSDGRTLDMISFKKEDILAYFPKEEFKVWEETVKTNSTYGQDWILYVERI